MSQMQIRVKSAMPVIVCLGRAALLATLTAPGCGWTQDYPTRPIRFIVGFVPGGIADLMARSLGQKLTEAWGQQVIIDNRAGAGGVIGMQIVAKALPDGYTLMMGSSTQFSITPALRPALPNPVADYTPISPAALTPVILTLLPSHPVRSVQELIQLAKSKPGQPMNYASTGYGTAPHIAAELLKRVADIDMTHVPYKGGGDAVIALLGGQVQVSFGAVSTALPHLRAGRMRALGVTSVKRLAAVPDVPTLAESGLPHFEVVQWYGVFAPARLPPPMVRKINETLGRALGAADFREHFAAQGVELMHSTPAEFAVYIKSEFARWTRVLKEVGISEPPT